MPHGPACQTPCYCFTPALPPLCAPATQQVILLDWQSEETSHLYSTMSASGSKYARQIRNAVCNYSVCKQLISFTAAHYKGLPHFRVHPHTAGLPCQLEGSLGGGHSLLEGSAPFEGSPLLAPRRAHSKGMCISDFCSRANPLCKYYFASCSCYNFVITILVILCI